MKLFNRCAPALLLGLMAVAVRLPARADSLYPPEKSKSMFADRRARAVGDVVTVVITESTVASQDAASAAQRSLNAQVEHGSGGLFGLLKLVPKATLGGTIDQKGTGSTSRSSKLVTTITCRVADITPGGQLVISGERSVRVNSDTQTIKFHGIARPDDVAPDNTIASGSVADARIEVLGNGPIDRHVRPGILSRIFQFLF